MHGGGWWFFGMHAFWWLFWVLLVIGVLALLTRGRTDQTGGGTTPLEILQRRFAAGEISAEEYESRKAILERDAPPTPRT